MADDSRLLQWVDICQSCAEIFRELWEQGAALEDEGGPNRARLIEAAVNVVISGKIIERDGGFFVRRTAKKIRTQVEKACTEAGILKEVAITVRDTIENNPER